MNTIKIIIISLLINLLLGTVVVGYTEGINQNDITNSLDVSSQMNAVTLPKLNQEEVYSTAVNGVLSLIEGMINLAFFIPTLLSLLIGNMILLPSKLTSSSNPIEQLMGSILTIAILINNIVLLLQFYYIIINKRSD